MDKYIRIKGAREHNLKNIDVEIPRQELVVLTGLSGSGKSTLAFDTIFAEGQRRYVESLSSYARQFLGQLEKPDVDAISGLSPAISIDQKTTSHNPRSTVGTVTEIYDFLRLLYARAGESYCPVCGKKIERQTLDQILEQVLAHPEGQRLYVLAPVVRGRKGEFKQLFQDLKREGYMRFRVDGTFYNAGEEIELSKTRKHDIAVVVDRLKLRPNIRARLGDSVETALRLADGLMLALFEDGPGGPVEEQLFSEHYACADCHISLPEPEPRNFSFNNPLGACPDCGGLGVHRYIDEELLIENPRLSLNEGAVQAGGWNFHDTKGWGRGFIEALAQRYDFSLDSPYQDLPREVQRIIMYGNGGEKLPIDTSRSKYRRGRAYRSAWEGVIPSLERRYREASSDELRNYYEQYMSVEACQTCHGARLRPESLAVKIGQYNIAELCALSISDCRDYLLAEVQRMNPERRAIAEQIMRELGSRLQFLIDVGLDYLSLGRASATLSGGEAQRIRLATQIGSGLMGVLYILDEPSIGLHQRDNGRLLATLKQLRDLGNSVLVVEHDEETIRAADCVLDLGPGAGSEGGELVALGRVEEIMAEPRSITGQYLSGLRHIAVPQERRRGNGHYLDLKDAAEHNLKQVSLRLPLGTLICVTGVSGSGKSSLVNSCLLPQLEQHLNGARRRRCRCGEVRGLEALDKVIAIDQSPIGRTPRSNPATYTGLFDLIRELFAQIPEARARGYKPGRFSFNVRGGRCEACRGDGVKHIEMHFLSDIYVPCEVCHGQRYNQETLEIRYKGKNIAEVLAMTVEEALAFFEAVPRIRRKLETLYEVGLSYMQLGQPSTQLSGGEAQRVKLATELSKRSTGRTFYILDEPTTGLHTADVHRLIHIVQKLVDKGNTVLIIEHNLDLIKSADYIVDLGPEGGAAGGRIVAQGSPEELSQVSGSYTGQYLRQILEDELRWRESEEARMALTQPLGQRPQGEAEGD